MKKAKAKNLVIGVTIAVLLTAISFSTAFTVEGERNEMGTDITTEPVKLQKGLERKAVTFERTRLYDTQLHDTSAATIGGAPLMATENNDHHPGLTTDGSGNVLAMAEISMDTFESNVGIRYSADGGDTWNPSEPFGWGTEGLERQPTVDYTGSTDFQGYGSYMPDPNKGVLPLIHFPSISDPEATWQDDDGWTPWTLDLSGNYEDYKSTDAAGYPHGEDVAPTPNFHGIIFSTCVDVSTGQDTLSIVYETEGTGVQLLYLPEVEGQMGEGACDIDLSTGEYFETWEWKDEPETIEDGVYIDHCYLEPGNPNWWEESWPGFVFEGASSPDVAAANGNCYLVFEKMDPTMGTTDIFCSYSHNNGENFSEPVQITDTGLDDEKYPVVSVLGDTILCAYYRNGDLYTAVSEDGGETWEEEEEPINEEAGTVVDEDGSIELAGQYVTWADNRGDTNDVYFDIGINAPVLGIGDIAGGFGITAKVTNTGTEDAEDVSYTISFDATIGSSEKTGTVSVPVGEEVEIKSGFVIGLGPTDISVMVGGVSQTASGFMLGPLVLGLS